jgi:hypothetical protein
MAVRCLHDKLTFRGDETLLYSFSGKLGVGADVRKYIRAQNDLKALLENKWRPSCLQEFEAELNCCPVIYDSDTSLDFLEPNGVDLEDRVIYISFSIDIDVFNSASVREVIELLSAGLIEGATLIKKLSPTDEQFKSFVDSLKV